MYILLLQAFILVLGERALLFYHLLIIWAKMKIKKLNNIVQLLNDF